MSISDLAYEAARRYCDAIPVRDWVVAALERHIPSAARVPAHVDDLTAGWRRVMVEQMVQYFNVAELVDLARLYATPESQSLMRKMVPFTMLVTPIFEAELVAWARCVTSVGTPSPGDAAQHRIP
jgi:hypothetical protein